MKKIAITQRLLENESYFEIRETLDIKYSEFVKECGFLPIILPYEVEFEEYFKNIDISGVILTGGNDLNSCNPNILSQKRDKFEKQLLDYCISLNIPILGVCRGMQLIADYFNCTFNKVSNQINIKHELVVNEKSKYNLYLNKLDYVNSYHNYSIEKISNELIISGTNKDGVIKAIEHKKYKIFAQMWHSERENVFNINEINLVKFFFNEY